jgi:hypothetical protein
MNICDPLWWSDFTDQQGRVERSGPGPPGMYAVAINQGSPHDLYEIVR